MLTEIEIHVIKQGPGAVLISPLNPRTGKTLVEEYADNVDLHLIQFKAENPNYENHVDRIQQHRSEVLSRLSFIANLRGDKSREFRAEDDLDLLKALPGKNKNIQGSSKYKYTELPNTRLFCVHLSDECILLLSGGVKNTIDPSGSYLAEQWEKSKKQALILSKAINVPSTDIELLCEHYNQQKIKVEWIF